MPHTPQSISLLLNEKDNPPAPEQNQSGFLPTPVSPFQATSVTTGVHPVAKPEPTSNPSSTNASTQPTVLQFSFSISPSPPSHRASSLPATAKPYACRQCNQSFSRPHNLKSHLATHSSERPFKCNDCPAQFRRHHDLKRHQKAHLGERPYTCDICHRSFSRLDALTRHRKFGKSGTCQPRLVTSRSHSPPHHTAIAHRRHTDPTTRPVIPPLNLSPIVSSTAEPHIILPPPQPLFTPTLTPAFPSTSTSAFTPAFSPSSSSHSVGNNESLQDAYAMLSAKYRQMELHLSEQYNKKASDLDLLEKKLHELEIENRLLRSIIVDTRNNPR